MRRAPHTAAGLLVSGLLVMLSANGATPVHKCVTKESVTYQRDPCPSDQVRKPPTPEQLNAEQRKRSEGSGVATGAKPSLGTGTQPAATSPSPTESTAGRATSSSTSPQAPVKSEGQFRCDGRKYCSQMTSCAEAKYFLGNCPGVQMDGDKNGIPCEKQWCDG